MEKRILLVLDLPGALQTSPLPGALRLDPVPSAGILASLNTCMREGWATPLGTFLEETPLQMNQTTNIEVIESERQKPIREVLLDLYELHRNWGTVAEILATSRQTLWHWRLRIGLSDVGVQLIIRQRDVERLSGTPGGSEEE